MSNTEELKEYMQKTQCNFCIYKKYFPSCIWQTKGKCEHYKLKSDKETNTQ